MRSRVELLRQQLQKEKDNVKKNKQLTKDAIQKKVEVNKIQQWVGMVLARRSRTPATRWTASKTSAGATKSSG